MTITAAELMATALGFYAFGLITAIVLRAFTAEKKDPDQ